VTFEIRAILLDAQFGAESLLGVSSHSAKATLLSWLAKAGLKLEDRRLLGGHAKPGQLVPLEYSRDALSGPLWRLKRVTSAVSAGIFRPDSARPKRWQGSHTLESIISDKWAPKGSNGDQAITPVKNMHEGASSSVDKACHTEDPKDGHASEEMSPSSPSSEVSGEDAAGDAEDTDKGELVEHIMVKAGFEIAYQVATFARHIFDASLPLHFVCGRPFSPNFIRGNLDVLPFCAQCLKRGMKLGCIADVGAEDFDGVLVTLPK